MEKRDSCAVCGAALVQPRTGRPRVYCGEVCRRQVEFKLKRVNAQLLEAEKRTMRARAEIAANPDAGFQRARPERELAAWAVEVERLRGELAALLMGGAQE